MKHQPWLPLARDLLLQQTAQSLHEQQRAMQALQGLRRREIEQHGLVNLDDAANSIKVVHRVRL